MDRTDIRILAILQEDSSLPVAEIAARVNLSQTPCWRRIQRLEAQGVIERRVALLNPEAIGRGISVFVEIEAADHSPEWLAGFAEAVAKMPEVMEVYRMAGDVDYLLRVVVSDMEAFDAFYKRLVAAAPMRNVTYSMSMSLDGYIVGPDGGFDWGAPDPEVFRFWIDDIRGVGVHLLGRRLYETMLYWETADQDPSLNDAELEWAALWNPLPKVVFSTTLASVQGNARLASGSVAEEIERLRAEPGEGDIAIGGATLAAEAAALDLIDEYQVMVYPVLVGGGLPYFAQRERRVDLELVETRTFSSGVAALRYRVRR